MDWMSITDTINKVRMEGLEVLEEILDNINYDVELPSNDVVADVPEGWAIANNPEFIVAWNEKGFIKLSKQNEKKAWEDISYYRRIKSGNYTGKIW